MAPSRKYYLYRKTSCISGNETKQHSLRGAAVHDVAQFYLYAALYSTWWQRF